MSIIDTAPAATRPCFDELLDVRGGLLSAGELHTRRPEHSAVDVCDALEHLVRAGLAHRVDGFYFASRCALDAAAVMKRE